MAFVRKNLSRLPEWDPILVWYARAVTAMQARPLDDPTSWRWQAAVHGFHDGLFRPGDRRPDAATREAYWNQCQHGSWFFLPWHRGYLAAFEGIVRAAVASLGGPADWALPYWDCGKPEWLRLRKEFCVPKLPDGADNPLFVTQRRAGFETGDIGATPLGVSLEGMMLEPRFEGGASGGGTGFGGPQTDFHHPSGAGGALEGGIHNYLHGRVGGPGGFMSTFEQAGLDPLFWLHHCNVDRLWEVWRRRDARHADPAGAVWRTGPRARKFKLYRADGRVWTFTSQQMVNTAAAPLDYTYEDVSDPLGGAATPGRLRGFAAATPQPGGTRALTGTRRTRVQVIGASTPGVTLGAGRSSAKIAVQRPAPPRRRMGLTAAPAGEARILLNLENITGVDPGQAYRVYVNLPDDGDPATEERHFVGMMSLFGVDAASRPDGDHAGNGLAYVFDITDLARARPDDTQPGDEDEITIDFVSDDDELPEAAARVGRISIVRETP